jgi:hypothetical protein
MKESVSELVVPTGRTFVLANACRSSLCDLPDMYPGCEIKESISKSRAHTGLISQIPVTRHCENDGGGGVLHISMAPEPWRGRGNLKITNR